MRALRPKSSFAGHPAALPHSAAATTPRSARSLVGCTPSTASNSSTRGGSVREGAAVPLRSLDLELPLPLLYRRTSLAG